MLTHTLSRRGHSPAAGPRAKSLPLLLALVTVLLVWGAVPPAAGASVFAAWLRWTPNGSGYVVIEVCIVEGSSTKQKGDGAREGLIHDTNPSLAAVLHRVRVALINSWEKHSSVRFAGWKNCNDLTSAQRQNAVGIYIHPDAGNSAKVGTTSRGKTTRDDPGVQFKPWGNEFNRCINYNWSTTHVEYSYDCVEQYAIHELGHALGFKHEWTHPLASDECRADQDAKDKPEAVVPAGSWSATYPTDKSYVIVNPDDYDQDSIMTYGDACADVTGVRFGSRNLSDYDIAGVKAVYPPAPRGQFDVGVFRDSGVCEGTEPITVYMDDEDDDNESWSSGWVGASHVDRNTRLDFCRADGSLFGKLSPAAAGARTADYAVLKLGDSCPAGSVEVTRYFDNEDRRNENYISGHASPNRQNFDRFEVPGVKPPSETELHMCLFRPENPGGATLDGLPTLSFPYGVAAAADFVAAAASGKIHTDDEDDINRNRLDAPDEATRAAARRIIEHDRNTLINLAKVSSVAASGERGLNGWYTSAVVATLESGGPATYFQLNGGAPRLYSGPFTIEEDGVHTLSAYPADAQGNPVGKTQTTILRVDKTAPAVSAAVSPAPTSYGWHNTDVVVSFTASDPVSGLAGLSPAVTLRDEGAGQSAAATAFDHAGNRSDFTLRGVNVDKTLPLVTYSGNAGSYTVDSTIEITCTAADQLSGIASHTCVDVGGPAYRFDLGANSFRASAADKAGNVGRGGTSFVVVVTFASLRNVVAALCDKPGVAQSLNSKLSAAEASHLRANPKARQQQLAAFAGEVNAQTGKSITAENAAVLLRLARAL